MAKFDTLRWRRKIRTQRLRPTRRRLTSRKSADPSAFGDPFHLELEDRRIGVKAPARAVGFHQGANLGRIKCLRRDLIVQLRWWGHGLQHGR